MHNRERRDLNGSLTQLYNVALNMKLRRAKNVVKVSFLKKPLPLPGQPIQLPNESLDYTLALQLPGQHN